MEHVAQTSTKILSWQQQNQTELLQRLQVLPLCSLGLGLRKCCQHKVGGLSLAAHEVRVLALALGTR